MFSGGIRVIFEGGVKYLPEEISGLQKFFAHLKEQKKTLPKELYYCCYNAFNTKCIEEFLLY